MIEDLFIGLGTMMLCVAMQSVAVASIVHWLLAFWHRGKIRGGIASLSIVLMVSMAILMCGNLLQIALWAQVFIVCGEFTEFSKAFYHSAVNFSTLGYGDIVMSEGRRLLGALEAANGVLMFGLTTSVLFGIIQGFIKRKYHFLDGGNS